MILRLGRVDGGRARGCEPTLVEVVVVVMVVEVVMGVSGGRSLAAALMVAARLAVVVVVQPNRLAFVRLRARISHRHRTVSKLFMLFCFVHSHAVWRSRIVVINFKVSLPINSWENILVFSYPTQLATHKLSDSLL